MLTFSDKGQLKELKEREERFTDHPYTRYPTSRHKRRACLT